MARLALEAVTKQAPGATALDAVSLALEPGTVHALVGAGGSGKSTLLDVAAGVLRPDGGRVLWDGEPVALDSPQRARALGIVMVRRRAALFDSLSVAENLALPAGLPTRAGGWVRWGLVRATAGRSLAEVGAEGLPLSRRAGDLSAGQRRLVAIAAAVAQRPRVLLLDEPTASLSAEQVPAVIAAIRRLADGGTAVLLATSDVDAALQCADAITVLRDGRQVLARAAAGASRDEVAAAMGVVAPHETARRSATERSGAARRGCARALSVVRAVGLLAGFAVVVAVLSSRVLGFASASNLAKLAVDVSLVAIAAVGLTAVVVGGGLDASVGAMMAVAAACSVLAVQAGVPVAGGLAAAVGVGLMLGAWNGALSALSRVHSAVVTLAMMLVYRWLFGVLLGGQPLDPVPAGLRALAFGEVAGVQAIVWVALAVVVGGAAVLRHHAWGRRLRATGGNRARAEALGIRTGWVRVLSFAVCGALVGVAGVLWAGEYGRLEPGLGGSYGLQVLAAVVLGGASLAGGGSVVGTALAALLVGVLYNGMMLRDVPSRWQLAFFALLIVAGVLFEEVRRRLAAARRRRVSRRS